MTRYSSIANSEPFIANATIEPPEKVGVRSSDKSNIGFVARASAATSPASSTPPTATPVVLDDSDRQLLALLKRDGRTDFTALATATRRPATTLRRRLADLRASGALYFDVDFDFRSLGLTSQTMQWLSVAPDQMVAAGQALAAHPEVPFAAATTGSTNLFVSVLCPDPSALNTYLTTKVATIPSVQQMKTAPVLQTLKTATRSRRRGAGHLPEQRFEVGPASCHEQSFRFRREPARLRFHGAFHRNPQTRDRGCSGRQLHGPRPPGRPTRACAGKTVQTGIAEFISSSARND